MKTGNGQIACPSQAEFFNTCQHRYEKIDMFIYTTLTSVGMVHRGKKKNQCEKLGDYM